ncbi:MAG: hypothetical protein IE926_14340 [Micrococcales bacterium]|uniref:hypothetical protein n=1 Tax=Phycicoccus sp. TaxID=1902410 RepID=UPI0019A4A1E1|nr:hypothetical protein [Phycicoccus sp.]MBD3784102.1 hypothetical protein [Micrococcales bacterium]HMM94191.1 hypothetical protein [Phycicoccus sp.]
MAASTINRDKHFRQENVMYHRRMQRIRRIVHQRNVHETQRMEREAANREQMQAVVHAIVR